MKRVIISLNDITLPEEDNKTFAEIQQDMDAQTWRGRASLLEMPEGGPDGAGGNADDSGDPIDTYHKHSGNPVEGPQSFVKGSNK